MKTGEKIKEVETFVNNAIYLAKTKGTIGDLENYCGLSPGYFSRRVLSGATKQSSLSFQTVLSVCEYLERPLEDLLNPKLRYDLEAKRVQQQLELIEQGRLSLVGEGQYGE